MDSSRFHILCQDEFLGFEQNDENGENFLGKREKEKLGQHSTIPALRLKHRSGSCVAKMLDNVGLRYPHRASGAKAPRTLRPLPLLRFAVSATGGARLCSIQYYLRFWLGICRTSLAVSALRIMRYCLNIRVTHSGRGYNAFALPKSADKI